MTNKNIGQKTSPTFEDGLRGAGYFLLMVWSVGFILFPPVAFQNGVGGFVLLLWLGLSFIGGAMAFIGVITRIDIKLEFPGILVGITGPFLYFISQVYFIIFPAPTDVGPYPRIAIGLFAFMTTVLFLPRAYALWAVSRRLKRIALSPLNNIKLSESEEEQPGAGIDLFTPSGGVKRVS